MSASWFEVLVSSGLLLLMVTGVFKVADHYLNIVGKMRQCRSACCTAEFSLKDSATTVPPLEPKKETA